MSITVRLSMTGKKHQKSYRIVVANTKSRRQGKPLETLGFVNPLKTPPLIKVDEKRLQYWKEKGALITEAVQKLTTKQSK